MLLEEKVWSEKYRPHNLKDCLLPKSTKKMLAAAIKKDDIPNMIFSGTPGIGKTTTARAILEENGHEYIIIPGSLKGNIDTLRNEIHQFASTVSFNGKKKFVVIDEADYISQATQAALRGFIQDYSTNCGFIFTCNFKNKILDAIAGSRLYDEVQFIFSGDEKKDLAIQLFKRCEYILAQENVVAETKDLQRLIVNHLKYSNDIRKLINRLQNASLTGTFDYNIETNSNERYSSLFDAIKDRDFSKARKWVGENSDIESNVVFRALYDDAKRFVDASAIPELVIIVAKYQYQHAFVADPEINLIACITEIMTDCVK